MDGITLSIIFFIVGSIAYTLISYFAKKLREANTAFNTVYIFSSLLSMFLVILLSPTFLLPSLPIFEVTGITGTLYIIFAAFTMGFTANFLVNLPLSYLIKELAEANVLSLTTVSAKPKHILMILATFVMIALIFGASVNAIMQYQASISTSGTIDTVGEIIVYADSGQSQQLEHIDWGLQEPGSIVYVPIYVKSTANNPVELYQFTDNWTPSVAQNYMTLTWDYNDIPLQPMEVRRIDLVLTVSPQISGITNFSFDITIVASG